MKRVGFTLLAAAVITLLPWMLRPIVGDRAALLWLPGFLAVAHWFPRGLNGPSGESARIAGCTANVVVWAALFWLVSVLVARMPVRLPEDDQVRLKLD